MFRLFFTTVVVFCFTLLQCFAADNIVLRKEISVVRNNIFLGDICSFPSSGTNTAAEALKKLEVLSNLKPLGSVVIKKSFISSKLRRLGVNVSITGSDEVRVFRRGKLWTAKMFEQRALDIILTALDGDPGKPSIEFLNKFRPMALSVEPSIVNVFPYKWKPYGVFALRFDFMDGGKKSASQTVSIRLDRKVLVSVLSRDLTKNETISETSIETIPVFASKLPNRAILDLSEYIGWKLRNAASRGSIIRKRQLQKVYLVKRGELVNIFAENFGISLSAKGYAKKDGAKRDLIPVQNVTSGKVILGKVLGKNTVQVIF